MACAAGIITGGGNVFDDLGGSHQCRRSRRPRIARKIAPLIAKRALTHAAPEVLKIDRPKVSAVVRGRCWNPPHRKRWQRYEKPQPGHRLQVDVKFLERTPYERLLEKARAGVSPAS